MSGNLDHKGEGGKYASCPSPNVNNKTFNIENKLRYFFSKARNYIRSLPKMEKKNFHDVFKGASPLGKHFFSRQSLR